MGSNLATSVLERQKGRTQREMEEAHVTTEAETSIMGQGVDCLGPPTTPRS